MKQYITVEMDIGLNFEQSQMVLRELLSTMIHSVDFEKRWPEFKINTNNGLPHVLVIGSVMEYKTGLDTL